MHTFLLRFVFILGNLIGDSCFGGHLRASRGTRDLQGEEKSDEKIFFNVFFVPKVFIHKNLIGEAVLVVCPPDTLQILRIKIRILKRHLVFGFKFEI